MTEDAKPSRTPQNEAEPHQEKKRKRTPSPPRERKRPQARITRGEREAYRARISQRQATREETQAAQEQNQPAAQVTSVASHYNAVPQRGREWRNTDSAIRNLRSYNNWVKSTLIQKFSPGEEGDPGPTDTNPGPQYGNPGSQHGDPKLHDGRPGLKVLDIGCGKGGDLQKWDKAPQRVELYVGVDPAAVSIEQAEGRYNEMRRRSRRPVFHAEFKVKDCYGEWLGEIPIIREIGISEEVPSRWQQGGFDVVSMMFCLHYAFESEEKARGMLRNVAGALKKGGRLIGVTPDSDVLRERLETFQTKDTAPATGPFEWGNGIYKVRFPPETPLDGRFKPPFGWKYSYYLEEAVELPEYVVPWEAFRALAEDVNLELQYRKPFMEVWEEEKDDTELGALAVRMKVTDGRGGRSRLSTEEVEAASLYHAFCFYKV